MARKAADLQWLTEGFEFAVRVHAKGVMIVWQADPNFNNEQHAVNPHDFDAYPAYVDALRTLTEGFDGQVALVHGDSHYFKVDKPLNRTTGDGVLGKLHPRRDIRRAQHALGEREHRPARSQPVRFRAPDRPSQRAVTSSPGDSVDAAVSGAEVDRGHRHNLLVNVVQVKLVE